MLSRRFDFPFLSTLSLRRATAFDELGVSRCTPFLSTLSLRRATWFRRFPRSPLCISIHALLAESDHIAFNATHVVGISIHALLAESDRIFLDLTLQERDFYPRSPCGERLDRRRQLRNLQGISIHALLAESDRLLTHSFKRGSLFLSTLSLRRATPPGLPSLFRGCYFYPRSPCGERQRP